jgi:hypothetical protein
MKNGALRIKNEKQVFARASLLEKRRRPAMLHSEIFILHSGGSS